MGNRRFIVLGVAAIGLALTLSGCSVSASTYASNPAAVAIGAQAVGFSASGWSSTVPCPATFMQSLAADLPAGATVSALDPTDVSGPLAAPSLTRDDVATCAVSYVFTGNIKRVQLYFFGMDSAHASAIKNDLLKLGFLASAIVQKTNGTEQTFASGTKRVIVGDVVDDGQSNVIVTG